MTAWAFPVSARRARWNRLCEWWRLNLGWPGALAVLLALVAVVLVAWVRPQVAAEHREVLRSSVARLAQEPGSAAANRAPARDPRDLAREALPLDRQRGQTVAQLIQQLERAGATAGRADYTLEDQAPGLSRLRVTVPVQGEYSAVRALVGQVLNALPSAALDSVELARAGEGDGRLAGSLVFSLYFRKDAK